MSQIIVITPEAFSALLDEKLKPFLEKYQTLQPDPVTDTDHLTTREVLDMLRCCRQTLFNYEDQGLLNPIRVTPRKKIYKRSEVMELLKK